MPLQIQYQPNAMMLGSMAQSAGEASYNRWLTEFNQQKMQMNANAFATGFANMGLPIAQMQSRERMVNAHVSARGQQLAQKRLDDVQWWDENGARVQDMVSSNLIGRHGPGVVNDPMFADQVVNAPKYMTREEGQKRLMDWSSNSEKARSHRLAWSPEALQARSAGRLADAEAASKPNPAFQQQMQSLQRRLNDKGLKPEAAQKMARSIMDRVQRHGDRSSRQQTHEEVTQALIRTAPMNPDAGPLGTLRTVTLDPKGGPPRVEFHNPNMDLMEQYRSNASQIEKLSEPPTEFGVTVDLTDQQKAARLNARRGLERHNKAIMQQIYGVDKDPAPDPIDAAQEFQDKTDVWSQQKHSAQGVNNQEYMDYLKRTGFMDEWLRGFGVSDPSELPAEWWTGMGFSSPPPKRPDDRGVMQRDQEDTGKAVRNIGILKELEQLRPNRGRVETPVSPQPPLRDQLQDIEREQRRESMAPESVDDAKQIRRAIGQRYGPDFTKWPPEAIQQFRDATEFIRVSGDPKPAAPKASTGTPRTRSTWSFGPSSSSPM